jgi:hypothetical protein
MAGDAALDCTMQVQPGGYMHIHTHTHRHTHTHTHTHTHRHTHTHTHKFAHRGREVPDTGGPDVGMEEIRS